MEANQVIDMRDETVKFCVSWVTILMCDLTVGACAHPTGLAGFTIRSMMCLKYGNRKLPPDFHFPISWVFVNEICKIENNHQVSIFHSVGCLVKIDQESSKLTSQSLQHWRQIDYKKPLSVLHWKLDSECWPNCKNYTTALF